jgi:hypothetical protein
VQGHLGSNPWQRLHQEVGCAALAGVGPVAAQDQSIFFADQDAGAERSLIEVQGKSQ